MIKMKALFAGARQHIKKNFHLKNKDTIEHKYTKLY